MSRHPLPRPPLGGYVPQQPPQPYAPQPVAYPAQPHALPSNPYAQYAPQQAGFPQYPMPNASGGYNPYAAYQQPAMAYAQPSFGQSLFRPTATPEGYSYSPAYMQEQQMQQMTQMNQQHYQQPALSQQAGPSHVAPPPAKRRRTGPSSITNGQGAKAWRNCSVQGCQYVGAGEAVELHEQDRHLIFPAGFKAERSEEEERYLKSKGPAPAIEGTNIRLETDEDIAKWIAERKARWPSAKRVADRESERQAAIARGDIPARGGGRGRGRGRGGFGNRRELDPAAQAEDWGREPVQREPSTRGRGRGRGSNARGGTLGQQRIHTAQQEEPQARNTPAHASEVKPETKPDGTESPAKAASAGVVAAYGLETSDLDDTSDSSSSSSESSSSESDESSDEDHADGPPTGRDNDVEMREEGPAAIHISTTTHKETPGAAQPDITWPARPVCKFFAKNGRCKNGNRCKFAHTTENASQRAATSGASAAQASNVEKRKMPKQPPPKKANPFDRPSMLAALLANPIQNTLSQLSQTIRFLVANDMLDGVELKPGDAEEQERQANKVVEIGSSSGSAGDSGAAAMEAE